MRTALEAETQAIARDLWQRMAGKTPSLFAHGHGPARLLDWAMRDPAVRTDLFRLVDVLPGLRSDAEIVEHVREYLLREDRDLPLGFAAGLKLATGLAGHATAQLMRDQVGALADHFIVGRDARSALPVLEQLRAQGFAFTADLLGEVVVAAAEADAYAARYLELIDQLGTATHGWPFDPLLDSGPLGPDPRANISIKVSAMSSFLDPVDPAGSVARARRRVLPLLERARARNAFINFDMEHWAIHGITLGLFESVATEPALRDWPHLGIAVQAYQRHARQDLERLLALAKRRGTPLTVRLVKGAYWEQELAAAEQSGCACPVFTDKAATDANFELLTRYLIEHADLLCPAIATHNLRSLAHALACARQHRLPPGALEIQMLQGMAEPECDAVRAHGERVRLYCPIGDPLIGIAYLVRRLLENTSNLGFLRLTHHERTDIEALLQPPAPAEPAQPAPDATGSFRNVPLTDFTVADQQRAFAAAVQRTRVPAVDPATATPEHLVATAYRDWPAWRDRPLAERAQLLERFADELERDRLELAALEVHEVAKPWREADADVAEAIDYCRYYARQALVELGEEELPGPLGERNILWHEGRGPAAIIAPWNFPLAILTGMSTAALVAGNTVILKPSGHARATGQALFTRMKRIGLPVQFLNAPGGSGGRALVEHPLVAQIAFTGSKEVGLEILQRAAVVRPGQPQLKRVVCEMGGKNAIIVDADADLDEAVLGIVRSAFGYAGQKCSAASRVLVVAAAWDAFTERLVQAVRSLNVAPATNPSCQVPPVISANAQQRLLAVIANPGPGAQQLFTGTASATGQFVPPTVFVVDNHQHRLMQEELFGPVLTLMRVSDFEQALRVATSTEFALTGGVYSRRPSHLEAARRQFRVGNLYLNRPITGAVVGRQPFGGHAFSGLGTKAGGPGYLRWFTDPRVLTENTMRRGITPEPPTAARPAL